ncbi:phospholipase A2 [Streptomyces lavendofoliae]|uniref:phospholipase A2 n=1 Tax=Streptomyces lavendofoliae TaxID=67314 RepID=UPI003D935232
MRRKLPTTVAALAFATLTALSGVVAAAGAGAAADTVRTHTAPADTAPADTIPIGVVPTGTIPIGVVPAGVVPTDSDTDTDTDTGIAPLPVADPAVRAEADRIMNLTYRGFARTPHVEPFNWTTDGCSVPVGFAPYSQVFRPACVQHDFGYRNYGAHHELRLSPTRETKNWIDGRFRTEMERICQDTYVSHLAGLNCANAARAYYVAVSLGGDAAFF